MVAERSTEEDALMPTVGLIRDDPFRPSHADPQPLDYLPPRAPDDVKDALRTRASVAAQYAEAVDRTAAAEAALIAAQQADRDDRVSTILSGTAAGKQPPPSKGTQDAAEALDAARDDLDAYTAALGQAEWSLITRVNAATLGDAWLAALTDDHASALAAWTETRAALDAASQRLRTAASALAWLLDWAEGRPSLRPASVPTVIPPDLPDRLLDPSPQGRFTPRTVAVAPDGSRARLGDLGRYEARQDAETEALRAAGIALAEWQQSGRTS